MSGYTRLTGWDKDAPAPYVRECFERTEEEGGCEYMNTSRCNHCEANLETLRRLAAYEDAGLSPNRVAELLKKLAEAVSGQLDSDITLGDVYGFVVGGDLLESLDKLAKYESTGLSPEEIEHAAMTLRNNNFKHINDLLMSWSRLLTENARLREQNRWIPISERLPEEGETILAWHKDGFVMLIVNMFDEMDVVTHWRPLPAGPEGVEQDG